MEALEKIQAFLKRLEEEKRVDLPKLVFFADSSCSIRYVNEERLIRAEDIESLLNQIDNYQWDTKSQDTSTTSDKS